MSRTNTTLVILESDREKVEALIDDMFDEDMSITKDGVALVQYEFFDVTEGQIEIEKELLDERIPFNKTIEAYDSNPDITFYVRFDEQGNLIEKAFEHKSKVFIDIEDVLNAMNDDTVQQLVDHTKVMPWNEQADYCMAYRK